MDAFSEMIEFFTDPEYCRGGCDIPSRIGEHLWLSGLAVAAAMVPALSVGLYIGHARRFEFIAVSIANLGRALPSFAILAIMFTFALRLGVSFEFWPTFVALFLLAIPPILTNAYVGVREVSRDTVEAAWGMGMKDLEILRNIEIPLAASLIVGGIRTSVTQVIATATLAALVAGPGLGRFIVDGFALGDDGRLLGGAVLVALLAFAAEVVMAGLQRLVTPQTV